MNVLGTPKKYIQGNGALDNLCGLIRDVGVKPLLVMDRIVMKLLRPRIEQSLINADMSGTFAEFGGECCWSNIDKLIKAYQDSNCDVIVGLGGGKTMDTAKAIKLKVGLPLVLAPTIASNDSPTSRVIVIYNEEGVLTEVLTLPFNPEIVLVDTGVISMAPARFLVAGMGDGLATKFEADQCYASGALNFFKARPCYATMAIADSCYQLIRKYGRLAKMAAEKGLVTEALERVVEANILLSGLGFESGGVAAAHALNHGFTMIEEMHSSMHGENVAFGLMVQFILENRSEEFLVEMLRFYKDIGLPCTLEQLGLKKATKEKIQTIAKRACREGSYIYNLTVDVDERKVIDALFMADNIGREFLSLN
jgi:glycerol dehydrogenase